MEARVLLAAVCLSLAVVGPLRGQVTVKSSAGELTFHGRLHFQGWASSCSGFRPPLDGALEPTSACDEGAPPFDLFLRRARASVQASLVEFIDIKLQLDFSGFDEVAIKDGYARLNFADALRFRFGNFKRPFDGFQLTSSSQMLVVERDLDIPGVPSLRALSLDELTTRFRLSDRDVGLELSGKLWKGRLEYWAVYMAGQQIQEPLDTLPNADSRGQWLARLQGNLQAGGLPLDLAVAVGITDRPFADSLGTIDGRWFTNLELWAELGDFGGGPHFQGEYVYGQNPFENKRGDRFDFPPTDPFALAQTFQVIGSYKWITRPPEFRPIRKRPIEGVEPIFRVTWADPNIDMPEDDNWGLTPGVQLFFYGRNKLSLNWDFALFTDGTDSANSFKLMLQGYF